MINIHVIRTLYPQWAAHSGINQFLKYLDRKQFRISERLVPMDDASAHPLLRSMQGPIMKRIEGRGNRIYALNDFAAELSACGRICIGNVDIIQYCDPEHTLNLLPGWLKKAPVIGRRKPVIVGMFHQPTSILRDILSPDIARDLDHVILMSKEQKTFFAGHVPEERISVILHGIDTDYYMPDLSKRDGNKFRCVTVGHWLRDYDSLEAVAERLVHNKNIEFHIVSSVKLSKEHANVTFHRNIRDDELRELYQKANLLFMPFKDSTANNAILEGMACGLPVLTTDLIATREYLEGADAVFVKGNDAGAFQRAIMTFAGRSEDRRRCGERSRQRAVSLSWQNMSRRYESVYQQLVAI